MYNCDQFRFELKFIQIPGTFTRQNEQIVELFDQLQKFVESKAVATDRVGFIFDHPDLNWSIDHPFVPLNQFRIERLISMFESVAQSRRELRFDENLRLSIMIAKLPTGSGSNIETEYLKNNNCIKFVYNSDNMCAIRAILIGKAYADDSPFKLDICKMNSSRLHKETLRVANALNLNEKACTLEDISKIEQYLRYYRISVFTKHGCIHRGVQNKKFIYLLLENNHFNAITNIRAFKNRSYFCHPCIIGFNKIGDHICNSICLMCKSPQCLFTQKSLCTLCNQFAQSEKCLLIHQEQFCEVSRLCQTCKRKKTKTTHVCLNEKYCLNCKKSVEIEHKCFVLTEQQKKSSNFKTSLSGFIFFDYEASQEKFDHDPNLVCALKLCMDCLDVSDFNEIKCKNECGKYEFTKNDEFCYWLFQQKNFTAIAHNMKGYDGVFIMNYIINNILPKDPQPVVIANGSKLLSIKFKQVKIIDSFCFIPIALSAFSEAFAIKEHKKGHFPHLFNFEKNQNYVGKYPNPEYYGNRFFTEKQLAEFNIWYDSVCHLTFDFKQEIRDYCWSDVYLLALGCLKFRKIIIELTKKDGDEPIDPFKKSITIASLCHLIFRSNHLEENTLAYVPEHGYTPVSNFSHKSIAWLNYVAVEKKVNIQHAQNGGEKKFGPYHCDGYDPSTNTIYEFHGCYFHGCPKCFTPETFNVVIQSTMKSIYARHCNRIKYLKSCCNHLVEIWECEFDRQAQNDIQMNNILNSLIMLSPLRARDALFGGRTNALKLHYQVARDEEIHYVDFTSLYPYVQKYCKFPVGHPKIITKDFGNPLEYFGLIKCRIHPPRGLYIPVLPCKLNNKLVFALCRTCAETLQQEKCTHSRHDRCLEGTWVTVEVKKALELGYEMEKIFEVWHWEQSEQYDSESKSGGLFTKYINMFLKGKQESSGFPCGVRSNEEKVKYREEFLEAEGIDLEIDKIEKNPAKRFVFKLFLNSMWGRLGMNTDRTIHKLITKPEEWFLMIRDDQYIIHRADFCNNNVIQVFYSKRYNEGSTETSVTHAAFVTAHARLKLYSELEKLNDQVLYFDTDSIIYVKKNNKYFPPIGNNLGDLTNELAEDDFIEEFISAGPKNYGYRTKSGRSSCTVKGFRLDANTSLLINFDSIKNLVFNSRKECIEAEQFVFKRRKTDWSVRTEVQKKLYRFVYDKRVLFDDLSTLPFGF